MGAGHFPAVYRAVKKLSFAVGLRRNVEEGAPCSFKAGKIKI